MREIFRKSDLAREAGVGANTITGICRTRLRGAMTPDGRRLFKDHPDVRAYVEQCRNPALWSAVLQTARRRKLKAKTPRPVDPFAQAAKLATIPTSGVVGAAASGRLVSLPEPSIAPPRRTPKPPTPKTHEANKRRTFANDALYDLYTGTAGALPEDLEDLGAMTLREVVERFGTLRALSDAVKARKDFADMKVKESAAAQRRGQLVNRALVSAIIVPLIDLAFRRLVGEMPTALTEQIIARVLAGGEDLKVDVEALIRRETSGILTDCRDGVAKELKAAEGPPKPSGIGRPIGS